MKKRLFLLMFVVMHIVVVASYAENIYVAQSAAGGNTGASCANAYAITFFTTEGNWANPKQAGKIGPGDTVFLCSTITSSLTLQNSGTSGSPITIDGTNATIGAAVGVDTNNASWWILQHMSWADQATTPPFSIRGGSNGIVDDAFADNLDEFALMFFQGNQRPDSMIVRNSFFRTRAFDYGQDEHDLIRSEGAINVIIEGNYMEMRAQGQGGSAHDDCIQTYESGSVNSSGPNAAWTIRYNRIIMNAANSPGDRSWTMLESATGMNYIYGNVFLGLQGGESANGVAMETNAGTTWNVYNNTIVAKAGSNNTISAGVGTGTLNVQNNIIYTQGQTALYVGPAQLNRSYNHWLGTNIPSCGGFTGELCGTDPLFVDYTNNNFALQSGSVDKDGGTNLGAGTPPQTLDYGIAPGATWPNPALALRPSTWERGAFVFAAGVQFLSEPTGLSLSGSTPTFLSEPTGVDATGSATPTFLSEPTGVDATGSATPTFLSEPTGLALTSP